MSSATGRTCPLCGADAFEAVWQWRALQHGCCRGCGHVYGVLPAGESPGYDDFRQLYPDAWLQDRANPLFALADHRAARIGGVAGRALEFGCGYGHFLHRLSAGGWRVHGVDASRPAAGFAWRHFGIAVATDASSADDERFDLIAAFHLLEHLADPRGFLRQVRALLAPGGALALAVPDLRTLPRDFTELHFIARGLHRHTFLPERLLGLLAEEGFIARDAGAEPPNRMSPSSFFVLARCGEPGASRATPEACVLITEFHRQMDERRARVGARFRDWAAHGRKVALFGSGLHTEALLALCGMGSGEIACIMDDDPEKRGQLVGGVPVVSPTDEGGAGCDTIVVSTLAAEPQLLSRLRRERPTTEIYGVYADLLRD